MKKGDNRKARILKAAEALFFSKGYEQTSVQDILDALKISKGGFYHYFATKEAVLLEISENCMEDRVRKLRDTFHGNQTIAERLDLLLRQVGFLESENTGFTAILIQIGYIDDDVRVRMLLRSQLHELLLPLLIDILAEGHAAGELFVRNPRRMASTVLHLVADADDDICRLLAKQYANYDSVLEALDILNASREAVESLLGARFGSLMLIDAPKLIASYLTVQKSLDQKERTR